MNGDLTPAEACELKASLGRVNGRPFVPASLPVQATGQPENVWTARKLAALSVAESAPTNPPGGGDQPSKAGEKQKSTPSSTTAVNSSKPGASEKRKKSSKNGAFMLL